MPKHCSLKNIFCVWSIWIFALKKFTSKGLIEYATGHSMSFKRFIFLLNLIHQFIIISNRWSLLTIISNCFIRLQQTEFIHFGHWKGRGWVCSSIVHLTAMILRGLKKTTDLEDHSVDQNLNWERSTFIQWFSIN